MNDDLKKLRTYMIPRVRLIKTYAPMVTPAGDVDFEAFQEMASLAKDLQEKVNEYEQKREKGGLVTSKSK